MIAVQNTAEVAKDFGPQPQGTVARWIAEIDLYDQEVKDWHDRCNKIIQKYRDERDDATRYIRRFALLWSNVETLKPVLYARLPKADVQRRFKDADPVARLACEISERALDYTLDCKESYNLALQEVVEDYLLIAQGVTWKRYVPHFKEVRPRIAVFPNGMAMAQIEPGNIQTAEMMGEGPQITNDAEQAMSAYVRADGEPVEEDEILEDDQGRYVEGEPMEVLDYEEVATDYINRTDFGRNAGARTWDEVYAVWRIAYLTRDELIRRFGEEIGKKVPLDYDPKRENKTVNDDVKDLFKKARIFEIWDKSTRKVYWIHKAMPDGPLDERDDPLGLSEFFPCPRPLWATQTNNTLVPIPDYAMYQDQDNEIQDITARIAVLEKAIRVRGLYPSNVDAIRTLLQDADDNDMVAIDQNVLTGMAVSDLSKAVWFWPLDMIVMALKALIEMRQQLLNDVYQVTGISDVLRGSTDPNETATAQGLKAQWGSIRVRDRQKEVARFVRDNLRLDFEIIFNHFEPSTIAAMTNVESLPEVQQNPQLFDAAIQLLKNKALRHFRVDIETDSTVAPDDQAEKQAATEFLTSFMQGLEAAGKVIPMAPELAPAIGEAMMFTARRFKASATLESTIETGMRALTDRIMQQMQNPQPDPAEVAKAQATQMKAQSDMQKNQIEQQRTMVDAQISQGEQALEAQRLQLDAAALMRDPNPQSVVN